MPAAEDFSNPAFAEFAKVFEHFQVQDEAPVVRTGAGEGALYR